MEDYISLYEKMESAVEDGKTSNFSFANLVSEPFFFHLLSAIGESHLFGHKKYQGADGIFLPSRRPMLIDVKFDSGINKRNPDLSGQNLFAEITKDSMPSSWLGAYHLKGGIGMINWHRKEAFLFDPLSVQKIFELWYQRSLKAVSSNIGTIGILVPCAAEDDVGRKEARAIFSFDRESFKQIK